MDSLLAVMVCILVVFTFGAVLISAGRVLSILSNKPKTASKIKNLPYECGVDSIEKEDTRVPVQFYLTAILFILFDIEIIFLYPWALSFKDFIDQQKGLEVLIVMLIFLLIFVYGLFWEIYSKALKWK